MLVLHLLVKHYTWMTHPSIYLSHSPAKWALRPQIWCEKGRKWELRDPWWVSWACGAGRASPVGEAGNVGEARRVGEARGVGEAGARMVQGVAESEDSDGAIRVARDSGTLDRGGQRGEQGVDIRIR